MGDMHCKTKSYTPANNIDIRHSFTGREALGDSITNCPPVNKIAEDLIAQMLSLPKTKDSYGLIHYDLDGYCRLTHYPTIGWIKFQCL